MPVIVLSTWAPEGWELAEALRRGPAAVIRKPFLITDLVEQAEAVRAHPGAHAKASPVEPPQGHTRASK